MKTFPKILVILMPASQKVRREKYDGILRYARMHGPWDIELMEDKPLSSKLGTFKNWRPDGIISRVALSPLAAAIKNISKIPTVYIDADPVIERRQVCVHHDLRRTSEVVAEYYLKRGLKNFAFVGSVPNTYWSRIRATTFKERLAKEGFSCEVYKPAATEDWRSERNHVGEWLQKLPKPCGLFAAFDVRAKQILDICTEAGIRVPQEIAIIGADNDENICENTVPTLSSVYSDFEVGGYMAAELLDRLMRGELKKPYEIMYEPKWIVARQSTQRLHTENRVVEEALEFIRLYACKEIGVPDVAKFAKVSRRLLEIRFREACGHTVLEEIQKRKLEQVCECLRKTSLTVLEVGMQCGFPCDTYLATLFKSRFGKTMREYRLESRKRVAQKTRK